MEQLLSICIPTYNRAEILEGCIKSIIPQAMVHDVPIYVSDNASGDDTQAVLARLKKEYAKLYYSRNESNVGAPDNIEIALKMSQSKYAWLFGDKGRLENGALDRVIDAAGSGGYDLLITNTADSAYAGSRNTRVKDMERAKVYSKPNELLSDLGWHMTLINSLVFNRELINKLDFKIMSDNYIPHFSAIFNYFGANDFKVLWIPESASYGAAEESGWKKNTFEVFVKKWSEVVHDLPSIYKDNIKRKCIKDHGVKSGLFNLKGFLWLRKGGVYNIGTFIEYYRYFDQITDLAKPVLLLIALTPKFLLKIASAISKRLKGTN